jgi:mRNA interferase MazF
MVSTLSSKQFEIYWTQLDPTQGSEIQKTRPCVVVSPDEMNNVLKTVMIVPLTRTIIEWPFRVNIMSGGLQVSAACDQLRAISRERLGDRIGSITLIEQVQILEVLQAIFSHQTV